MVDIITVAIMLTAIALVCGIATWHERRAPLYGRARTFARIRTQLDHADQEVTDAYQATRRAMNKAVGQSWRNLTD